LKSNWDVNLMLDHIIPKELAPQNSWIRKVLGFNENLRLVHIRCQKKKQQEDQSLLFLFKKTIQFYFFTDYNMLSKRERLVSYSNQNINVNLKLTALYNILWYINRHLVYTYAYMQNSLGCILYRKFIGCLSIINKWIKNNINFTYNLFSFKFIKSRKFSSHRLKSLKIRNDKKSQNFR
jgi:hypothetical protein